MSYNPHRIAIAAIIALAVVMSAVPIIVAADANATPAVAMVLAVAATTTEPLAYSIKEFCRAHGISPPTYYQLKHQGLGPVEMRMGAVVRISAEAAAAWRRARENPGKVEAAAATREADLRRERARSAAAKAIELPKHVSQRKRA